jgi:site-specific DNA recombinase
MNVGIWVRVSTEDQAKGDSPKNHEARARLYAEQIRGWNVVDLYDLSGVSGKSIIDHPECKRMLQDIASGKIRGIIFSKLARLCRNVKELIEIAEHFTKCEANLISLDEAIDTSTPAGRLLFTVIAALAQFEREEIAARVSASIPIRAKLGKPTGGIGPFGYMWKDRQLIPNPDEAPIVKRIFELFLENGKLLTTCQVMEKEGMRARKSRFRPVTLKRVLTDSVYRGLKRANYSKSKGNNKSWELKPEKEWVFQEVTPIIPTEMWEQVNAILRSRKVRYKYKVPTESATPFGGLLICGCGKKKKMYVFPYKGMRVNRYVCKECGNKINEDILMEKFQECLESIVIHPDHLSNLPIEDDLRAKKEKLSLLKRENITVDSKMDKLIELWGSELINREDFRQRYDKLKIQKDQLVGEIFRLNAEMEMMNTADQAKDYLLTTAKSLSELWDGLNQDERKKVIREILDSVEITKSNITFTFYHLPELMPLVTENRNFRGSWQPQA